MKFAITHSLLFLMTLSFWPHMEINSPVANLCQHGWAFSNNPFPFNFAIWSFSWYHEIYKQSGDESFQRQLFRKIAKFWESGPRPSISVSVCSLRDNSKIRRRQVFTEATSLTSGIKNPSYLIGELSLWEVAERRLLKTRNLLVSMKFEWEGFM